MIIKTARKAFFLFYFVFKPTDNCLNYLGQCLFVCFYRSKTIFIFIFLFFFLALNAALIIIIKKRSLVIYQSLSVSECQSSGKENGKISVTLFRRNADQVNFLICQKRQEKKKCRIYFQYKTW